MQRPTLAILRAVASEVFFTRHGNETAFLLDTLDEDELVLVCSSCNDSQPILDSFELHFTCEFDTPHLGLRLPEFFVSSNSLSELFTRQGDAVKCLFRLINDTNSMGNCQSCLDVISGDHSHIRLILDSFLHFIGLVFQNLAVFDKLNGLSNGASNWIIQSKGDQVNQILNQFRFELWVL